MNTERDYFSHVDAGRPVLQGHRRSKQKLLNPFSGLPLTSINTTADIFPELLWISLLFETFGYHRALRIARSMRVALEELNPTRSWCRLSELAMINTAEWEALSEEEGAFKADAVSALSPLQLYPQLRLEFLRGHAFDRDAAIATLERCVARHSNRFETGGAATIGTFVFLEAYVGRIAVPREVLEGISAIVDKPGSDEAELGASGARAVALAFWTADSELDQSWPQAFWRTNLQLSPCRTKAQGG